MVALAIMMPLSQGMLSDLIEPERRGIAFGRLGFWSNIGGMLGGSISTAISAMMVLGCVGQQPAIVHMCCQSHFRSFA